MQSVFVLGVGAQKAGTTWLHNYLQERPDSDMGMVKEYHVLDVRFTPAITDHAAKRAQAIQGLSWLHRFLPAAKQAPAWRLHRMERKPDRYFDYFEGLLQKPGVRLTGDITPSYSALPVEAMEQVKQGFAARGIAVKVVFLMRDPAERTLSATRRYREKYPERSSPGAMEEVMKAMCRSDNYEARARYEQTLARLEQVFAPEDTFLCLYENLFTTASIERLCGCLGVPTVPARFDERVNSAGDRMALSPELRKELLAFYRGTIEGVAARLGRTEVGAAWPGALDALNEFSDGVTIGAAREMSTLSPLSAKFLTTPEVATRIDAAVETRAPFSLVRLGDGEGALLSFSPATRMEDTAYLASHFGPRTTTQDFLSAQARLIEAISTADVLGVRDDVWHASADAVSIDPDAPTFVEQFRAAFPLRDVERAHLNPHGYRRIYQLWKGLQQNPPAAAVCSAWAPVDLQLKDYWERMIGSQSSIGLIGHSASLAKRLRRRFGCAVDFIAVPGNAIDPGSAGAPADIKRQHASVWPDIAASIPSDLAGRVVFIAAGLIGKHYCRVVKARGGIALDIGALADAWDGRATRGLVYRHKTPLTASPYAPPPEFTLGFPRRPPASTSKRLIVHVGFSKTGTTGVQNALAANEAALAAAGVSYLRSGRSAGGDINHHELARALGAGERRYDEPSAPPDRQAMAQLFADIAQEMRDTMAETCVISSELLTNFAIDRRIEDDFAEWLRAQRVTVVFHVRNQYDWLVSWYTQAAKNANMGLWLDEFVENPAQLPNAERFDGNFLRKIAMIERYVGREAIHVRSYDDDVHNDGLVESFCRFIGVPPETVMIPAERANATPTDSALIGPILDRRLGRVPDVPPVEPTPQDVIDRALLRGRYAHRRDELRAQCADRFRAVNEELRRRYGVIV